MTLFTSNEFSVSQECQLQFQQILAEQVWNVWVFHFIFIMVLFLYLIKKQPKKKNIYNTFEPMQGDVVMHRKKPETTKIEENNR